MTAQAPRLQTRNRKVVSFTVDPNIRAQLVALATARGITLSYALELVLTRQLALPPLPTP